MSRHPVVRLVVAACVAALCLGVALPAGASAPAKDLPTLNKATLRPGAFKRHLAGMRHLPANLKLVRLKLLKHQPVNFGLVQKLADRGDGLSAFAFAGHIMSINGPNSPAIAAHYYAIAAYNGRPLAVRPLVDIMTISGPSLPAAVVKQASEAIEVQALHDNPDALKSLLGFYGPGGLFGSDAGKARGILARSAEKGNAASAMALAMNYIGNGDTPAPADRDGALKYLVLADKSGDLGTRAIAENLIRSLGAEVPETLEAKS